MNYQNQLDLLLFINLPESFDFSIKDLKIDPKIQLPVRCNSSEERNNFKIENLKLEDILSGILLLLSYDEQNPNISYYKNFILKARPNIRRELTNSAILLAKDENFELAEEIFSALRALSPTDMVSILNSATFYDKYADFYRKNELFEDADACDSKADFYYKLATESEKILPDAFFNAGFFYAKKRDFSKAKNLFETYIALVVNEKDEQSQNFDQKIEKANEMLFQIENLNMDDELYNLAYSAISNDEIEKGLENARKFLSKNQKNCDAWFLLGWGLRKSKKWEEAKSSFEKSIELGFKGAEVHNELALCLIELGKFNLAETSLAKALQLDGENTKYMSNLGFLELKRGNENKARQYFLSVLEYNEKDPIAIAALKSLQ